MTEVMKVSHQKHSYKLHYFDIKGRGEPIRLIFEYFKISYDDVRIKFEDWPSVRKNAPLRFLPYLEVDKGKLVISEAPAIMRYLAKSFRAGFAGNSKSDSARVDMYGEGAFDMFDVFMNIGMAPEEQREEALENTTPRLILFCDAYTEHLKKNGNKFINGQQITWPDLVLVFVLSALDDLAHSVLKKYNELVKYYLRMRDLDELREYIKAHWKPTKLEN